MKKTTLLKYLVLIFVTLFSNSNLFAQSKAFDFFAVSDLVNIFGDGYKCPRLSQHIARKYIHLLYQTDQSLFPAVDICIHLQIYLRDRLPRKNQMPLIERINSNC